MENQADVPAVTAEDLQSFRDLPPNLRGWLWQAYYGGVLDIVVRALRLSGRVETAVEAVRLAVEVIAKIDHQSAPVAVADLTKRKGHSRHLQTLQRILTGFSGRGLSRELLHGIISHQAIHSMLSGQLRSARRSLRTSPAASQLDLFGSSEAPVEISDGPLDLFPELCIETRTAPSVMTDRMRRHRISQGWQYARNVSEQSFPGWDLWRLQDRRIDQLAKHLEAYFGEYVGRIRTSSSGRSGPLETMTYLTWAAAVSAFRHERYRYRTLFREVPVLSVRHGVGGGRIDALEVRSINHRPPNVQQRRVLDSLAIRTFSSTGHLLRTLAQYFNAHLEVAIIDWKFYVGDILRGNGHPTFDLTMAGALPEHREQMLRYLTLIPVDVNLAGGRNPQQWAIDRCTLYGEVVYILPRSVPIIVHVQLTPDEREQHFLHGIAANWRSARRSASQRMLTNAVLAHAVGVIKDQPRRRKNGHVRRWQTNLFAGQASGLTARELLDRHYDETRRYLDPDRIVELVGHVGGAPRLELHYDRLQEAIVNGRIPSPVGLTSDRGGKIHCLSPDHVGDRTPSMHLYLQNSPPSFYCFGCEIRGIIVPESLPVELLESVPGRSSQLAVGHVGALHPAKHRLAITPDEHAAFMGRVQQLLHARFIGSPAERYISRERRIDPSLAEQYGAGFGDETLVHLLLDDGRTLDELAFYGLIGFSARVPADRGLGALCQSRGLGLDDIRRPVGRLPDGSTEYGLPYFVLRDRVTFPLMLGGKCNNFYGRATYPCQRIFAHRKLAVKQTRVEHGAFNAAAIDSNHTGREVIVAEGVMDVLSLLQLGYEEVVGLVGVMNETIFGALVRSGKDLAIALDNDETGRTKTLKLIARLRGITYAGQSRDFTAEFTAIHPEMGKDYNEWLIRHPTQPPIV